MIKRAFNWHHFFPVYGSMLFVMLAFLILLFFGLLASKDQERLVFNEYQKEKKIWAQQEYSLKRELDNYHRLIQEKSTVLTEEEKGEYRLLVTHLSSLQAVLAKKENKNSGKLLAIERYRQILQRIIDADLLQTVKGRELAERQRLIAEAQQMVWEREKVEAKRTKKKANRIPAAR